MRNRPQLGKAIDMLGAGDVLVVVAECDWATRSMIDGVAIIVSALAEDERQRILARCVHGRKVAKAKGVRFGRKTKLNEEQHQEARRRLDAGESARSIGKIMCLHHATVLTAVV